MYFNQPLKYVKNLYTYMKIVEENNTLDHETKESEIIQSSLPKQMSLAEVEKIIKQVVQESGSILYKEHWKGNVVQESVRKILETEK